jgi:putative endonuclease
MPASRYKNGDGFSFIPAFVLYLFMPHFIYILYSQSPDRYCIGTCADVGQRITVYNAGETLSPKSGSPWLIVHPETYPNKNGGTKTRNPSLKITRVP